ncbi:MAG: TetR family transcriptional regulator [Rhodobacteraceae bacterium]|nr:TetR family transcriptional regulator [Paracoccaceae bacterium]MAY45150.1 TetR family transcriptional regulator [Paracoccaceae bacterium]QEW21382.1 Intercellular adhesion protein R [Marinibacterium anthonyi]
MNEIFPDTKKLAILDAAITAFSGYGFRKTSMDDIARGAAMSRPALYMHFRNKEDILRSLVQLYYAEAAGGVRAALSGEGSVAKRLHRAFLAQAGRMSELLVTSPHGMELLESSSGAAGDLVAEGEAGLRAIYADWLAYEMSQGRVDLRKSPDHVAGTLTAALKGLKQHGKDPEGYKAQLETLAVMVSSGLARR